MLGTKLNAQVIIKNLQNMHAKSLGTGRPGPPTGARGKMELEYHWQDWARLHCQCNFDSELVEGAQGTTP